MTTLTVLLLILKLTGILPISFFIVLLPVILEWSFAILLAVLAGLFQVFDSIFAKNDK